MPTANPAPTTSAANSTDITVTSAAPVNVGLYTAAGGALPGGVRAPLARKNPSGTYDKTGLELTSQVPNLTITGAGVYRVEKPATTVAVGVSTD